MAIEDMMKAVKRALDGNISFRRALFLSVVVCGLLLYVGPVILRWMFGGSTRPLYVVPDVQAHGDAGVCIGERLAPYAGDLRTLDAAVSLTPAQSPDDHRHLPYVANGHLALVTSGDGGGDSLMVRGVRTLNVTLPFRPLVTARADGATVQAEATLVQYTEGTVQRIQCQSGTSDDAALQVTYKYFAHRRMPSVLVQEIRFRNPGPSDVIVELSQKGIAHWNGVALKQASVPVGVEEHRYMTASGVIEVDSQLLTSLGTETALPSAPGQYMGVVIVSSQVPSSVTVKASSISSLQVITVVNYTLPQTRESVARQLMNRSRMTATAVTTFTDAVSEDAGQLLRAHVDIWRKLWKSGISISHSLAGDVINGDLINATMYYVMSQTRAPIHEQGTEPWRLDELRRSLQYSEGCYGDKVHTLQAPRLWSPLQTAQHVLETANLWLMLLEKKGCHTMLKAGADGVVQAMILSMGALKFSNQHLELGMEPKDMHRDYTFRRINFGNATHINITVTVDDQNQAHLNVAVDRSDRTYYACDAGCLDPPVRLGLLWTRFPVKQTDPPTAALYITYDWQHLEELKHTIHVKEVSLAPAHDQHLMAMHRHGHVFGGLPAIFWVTIFLLIALFHLFLIKLIVNEYCGSGATQDRYRSRKFSDYR